MKRLQQSYAGGELSPKFYSRAEDAKFQHGAAKLRNYYVEPQGSAVRRPGSRLVARTKNDEKNFLATFRFSLEQSVAVAVGPGYFRFFTGGAPLLLSAEPAAYFASRNFAAADVSTAADTLTLTGHGLTTGEIATVTATTAVGGGLTLLNWGLNEFQDYAVIVIDANTLKFALTVADALANVPVNLSGVINAGAAYRIHRQYQTRDLIRFAGHNYYTTRDFPLDTPPTGGSANSCSFAVGTPGVVTQASHGYVPGTAVVPVGVDLPPELTSGTTYFVVGGNTLTTNTFRLSATYGGAALNFTTAGGGAPTIQRTSCFYQLTDDSSVVANGSIYEIPNNYSASDLFELRYDTSFDVMTFTNRNYPASELRRFGATSWDFGPVSFATDLARPAIGATSSEFGEQFELVSAAKISEGISFEPPTNNAVALGDTVYWTTDGTFNDGGSNSVTTDKFYRVSGFDGSAGKFLLREIDTGVNLSFGAGTLTKVGTPTIRVTTLGSEKTHTYVVTAVDERDRETGPSAEQTLTNNLLVDGASNEIRWSPIAGAKRYRVYKKQEGLFGFLGEVTHVDGTVDFGFVDSQQKNLTPDLSRTLPIFDADLSGTDYPGAVAHFEQRRLFGGSLAHPQRLWGTRSGTEGDLSFHIPLQDDDRLSFDLASLEAEEIRHIVPLAQLVALTSAAEYRISPTNTDALTPTSRSARPQSFIGSAYAIPVVVNSNLVFAAARGGHVREFGFSQEINGYLTGDLSLRATHLFDRFTIAQLAYQKAPVPIVWAVSSSGKLLGITYAPEEQLGAWHQHDTNGTFESATTVPEGDEDTLYVEVLRNVNGSPQRFIEQLRGFSEVSDFADNFYVDCGITYTGGSNVIPVPHLNGMVVDLLVDGVVYRGKTVTGGVVTLPVTSTTKVHAGLRFSSDLVPMPLTLQIEGFGHGNTKNANLVHLRVYQSARFQIGLPDGSDLVYPAETELTATGFFTGVVNVTTIPDWSRDGQFLVRQDDPLPLTIVGMTVRAGVGG